MTAKNALLVETIQRPNSNGSHGEIDYRELVRMATLAASSHNTQPWKFLIEEECIRIFPDYDRTCPAVDPDNAHLFKSLGCAAENLIHAANSQGLLSHEVPYDAANDCVVVSLKRDASSLEEDLSQAISKRQCTKSPYDGKPLNSAELDILQRAGMGNGVRAIMLNSNEDKEAIIKWVNEGNLVQFSDRDFLDELKQWVRPNRRESLNSRDGLSGATTGKPSLPSWLFRLIFRWVVTPQSQCKEDTTNIRSSAGIAVFVSNENDKAAWVESGRCFERFALQATTMGIRTAFINQPIEVPAIRSSFQDWLGLEHEHAQLMIRFGRCPEMPYSVRRPIDDVILSAPPATSLKSE